MKPPDNPVRNREINEAYNEAIATVLARLERQRKLKKHYRIALPPGGASTPMIAHVPHSSTIIPESVREEIVLDDAALDCELLKMTDWHTEELFSWVLDQGGVMFVSEVSRLVFDPERFPDDEVEPMARVGQGVVYERTSDGNLLSVVDPVRREERMTEFSEPYHCAMTNLVATLLEQFGSCLILDGHSFASVPLPNEPDQNPDRPDICLGTDPFHTPPELAQGMEESLGREGFRVRRDAPFTGTFVPLDHYRSDPQVASILVEVRRGLYCDEGSGERNANFDVVRSALGRMVIRGGFAL